jgi:Zn-dependent protease/CBS domain-containing protein
MRWSWHVGTFRGIGVYLHATFLLLVGWIFLAHLFQGRGLAAGLAGVAFIVLLFLCVVLHEFGHALTAQRFGIETRDITLYPIGGVARLERIPRDPHQELLIALAGPAVNVVIAAVLFLFLAGQHLVSGPDSVRVVGGNLLSKLLWVNVSLVAFNLLPAFPMDGGRVLRAFLALRMEYGKATQTAANVGQGMALLFGLFGLLWNPFLLFVAFFVFLGAGQEAGTVQAELAFQGVPAQGAMMTQFATLAPTDPLARAVDMLLAGPQQDFPVLQDSAVVGVLSRDALVQGLSAYGPECVVAHAMRPAPPAVSPLASLEETVQKMREAELQSVPVLDEGRLVGWITLENIGEFLMVRSAVEQRRPPAVSFEAEESRSEPWDRARPRRYWMPRRRARG